MSMRNNFLLLLLFAGVANAQPLGTNFTYQGELQVIEALGETVPGNGQFDFTFTLFDGESTGNPVAAPFTIGDITVIDGIFTVDMDFGVEPYTGDQLWLQVAVRNGADTGPFTNLLPRQALTPAPFAILSELVSEGSVGELEVVPSEVQLRVNEICPAGSSIRAVNEDGSAVCETDSDEQNLSLAGTNIIISNGNSVDIAPILNDNDASNELNTSVAFDGTNLTVSDAGGDLSVDLSGLNSAPQTLSLNGTDLSISDGNNVDLATALGDNDANNELNTGVAFDGANLTVSDAGGDLAADLSDLVNDDTNELNTDVNFDGNNLAVSDAGGTQSADLSALINDDDNELNTDVSFDGINLSVTDAAGSQSADLSALVNDDNNELNTGVSFDGNNLSVTDAGGSQSVDISTLVNDDSNELNTGISFSGGNLTVSDAGGDQSVSLAGVVNNDSNELNTGFALLPGNILSISDAGSSLTADLSGFLDNTDAQTLSLNNTSLSITGGNAVDLAALFGDSDPTNELNTGVSFDGANLSVTDAGGILSADLSALSDTAAQVLAKLITVDGADSGLDADLLDGMQASEIIAAAGSDNRIPISTSPFTITEPGSYIVTQNLIDTIDDTNGIRVEASNVTIDLGGFRLLADMSPDDISVSGRHAIFVASGNSNIHILNGHIDDWGADGLDAGNCTGCIFENLTITNSRFAGLVTGESAVVSHVIASFNGDDGIELGNGTVVAFSTAQANGNSGFASAIGSNRGEGVSIINSTAFENTQVGFELEDGATVIASSAYDNLEHGFELNNNSTVQESSAYDNGFNGFEVSSGMLRDNIAAQNGGLATSQDDDNGFRVSVNSYLINNLAYENDGAGIRVTASDATIENNIAIDNDRTGIESRAGDAGNATIESLYIRNRAAGNSTANFDIAAGNSFGPIINIANGGDISLIANADHPMANFEY